MTKPNGANRTSKSWTPEEDDILREFAGRNLPWTYIADLNLLPTRTVYACQTRWNNYVCGGAKFNRANSDRDRHHYDDRSAGGDALYSGPYVFRVPDGDPYLQRLIRYHGNDNINRDVVLIKTKSA